MRPSTDVWPIRLSTPLPTVAVPLLAGDADVSLDLQQAMSNVYDLAGYDLAVDYSVPPETALGRRRKKGGAGQGQQGRRTQQDRTAGQNRTWNAGGMGEHSGLK